jgi:hypothetical protein
MPAIACTFPAIASWRWTRVMSRVDGPGGWQKSGTVCHTVGAPPEKPRATLGQILNTAKHLPFDRATIETQPSDRTLVGLDTIFWTSVDDEYWDNVNVAGEHIDFRATPRAYVWSFGDGSAAQELGPGAPYPNQSVTHAYHRTNTSPQVVVTVRWRAEYRREDETAWQAVPDLIDGLGVPRTLSVAPAHSQLLEGPR